MLMSRLYEPVVVPPLLVICTKYVPAARPNSVSVSCRLAPAPEETGPVMTPPAESRMVIELSRPPVGLTVTVTSPPAPARLKRYRSASAMPAALSPMKPFVLKPDPTNSVPSRSAEPVSSPLSSDVPTCSRQVAVGRSPPKSSTAVRAARS